MASGRGHVPRAATVTARALITWGRRCTKLRASPIWVPGWEGLEWAQGCNGQGSPWCCAGQHKCPAGPDFQCPSLLFAVHLLGVTGAAPDCCEQSQAPIPEIFPQAPQSWHIGQGPWRSRLVLPFCSHGGCGGPRRLEALTVCWSRSLLIFQMVAPRSPIRGQSPLCRVLH